MVNDTTRLLGLAGLAVVRVEDAVHDGPVVHLVTADEQACICPGCGVRARRVKGWVTTSPRDLPVAGRPVELRWCKRRWHCDQQGCDRKTFTEAIGEIPARPRVTTRLRQAAGAAVADGGRTIVQAARDHGLSWPVVSAAFTAHATAVLPDKPQPVAVLGIDEIRRGRPQWTWNDEQQCWEITVDRWHVGFVDLAGGQGLLGQVEGRTSVAVRDWLTQWDEAWRQGVRVVAIDMCTVFKAAARAALPQARLVVDHFHLVQLANQALTEVRRRVTLQVRGRRGRKGNREWELRNRLTRSAARMHEQHLDPMIDDLRALPAVIGTPILAAWNAKEDLLDLLALARTHPDRATIWARLSRFYERCAASGLPELERLAGTVSAWWPEILAFLDTDITNAGSEGTNRVIKTVARDAYGFRNPASQRLRTRCATTRKARGCLNPA
ncbi:ISL3 family transposase [Kibdelosporangium philippinense]|uniref:ISL3 family transposase n=1 Tax=Kibdelosporangium philippinense TaxID=211113 RepID=UPI0036235010